MRGAGNGRSERATQSSKRTRRAGCSEWGRSWVSSLERPVASKSGHHQSEFFSLRSPLRWLGHLHDDTTLALLCSAADVKVVPYAERHAQLGGQARERALRLWSPDAVVPQYLEVYQAAIDAQAVSYTHLTLPTIYSV